LYGYEGLAISISNANGTLYKYLKLIEKNKFLPVTLTITTYNRPEALNLVLESVINQTVLPDEIIIADDGSDSATKQLVENWMKKTTIPIIHIWHEKKGFRAAKIRNEAIKAAKNSYLIFIDGDMVLHRNFIEDHIKFAKKGSWIQGSRVLIDKHKTSQFINKKITQIKWHQSGIKNRLNAIRCPILADLWYMKNRKDLKSTKTCNIAFWKEDAYLVNGFDEDFVGWGKEDTEFVARLMHNGIKRKDLKFSAIAYHLDHPFSPRTTLPENEERLRQTILKKKQFCVNGLVKKDERNCTRSFGNNQ
jgi:glycosyltransferase involved in cell wall biosynthesis